MADSSRPSYWGRSHARQAGFSAEPLQAFSANAVGAGQHDVMTFLIVQGDSSNIYAAARCASSIPNDSTGARCCGSTRHWPSRQLAAAREHGAHPGGQGDACGCAVSPSAAHASGLPYRHLTARTPSDHRGSWIGDEGTSGRSASLSPWLDCVSRGPSQECNGRGA